MLTDVQFQHVHAPAALAALAAAGGADTVQFRDKHATARDAYASLVETVAACRKAGVPCVVNDRLDLALAAEADGVHLGQDDLPIAAACEVLDAVGGAWRVVGATVTTAEQARAAEAAGAHYLGFGPVFPTASKANPASVKGVEGLAEACAAVRIPVVAIAGITPERVAACLDAGAWGVAVMTAVTTAPDVAAATARFREAIDRWR